MYIGTLTLTLVLAVFGAVLLAVALGNQIARPLLVLAEGVRQVAAGDLEAKPVFASRDELGGLTRDVRADDRAAGRGPCEQVQRGVAQLEGARTRLQTILDSLTAGVIVFDREQRIDSVNPGATRILRQPLSAYRGRTLTEVPGLAAFAQQVAQRFELHRSSARGRRARPLAGRLRAAPVGGGSERHAEPAGARRGAAGRRAADGVRRHHRDGVGAAQRGLGRGGAPPGARDQEPAHADPAVGRAAGAQAAGPTRRNPTRRCWRNRWPPSWPRCRR